MGPKLDSSQPMSCYRAPLCLSYLISFLAKAVPFVVTFTSDSFEINDEGLAACLTDPATVTGCNAGFRLYYEQSSTKWINHLSIVIDDIKFHSHILVCKA